MQSRDVWDIQPRGGKVGMVVDGCVGMDVDVRGVLWLTWCVVCHLDACVTVCHGV